MRYLIIAGAFVAGMVLATAVKSGEESYDQCYKRITEQGGSDNMVAWICGYRSGYFTDE